MIELKYGDKLRCVMNQGFEPLDLNVLYTFKSLLPSQRYLTIEESPHGLWTIDRFVLVRTETDFSDILNPKFRSVEIQLESNNVRIAAES